MYIQKKKYSHYKDYRFSVINGKWIAIDIESVLMLDRVVSNLITPSMEDEFFSLFGLENCSLEYKQKIVDAFWIELGLRVQKKVASSFFCNSPKNCYCSYHQELERLLYDMVINWLMEQEGIIPLTYAGVDLRKKVLKENVKQG